jgi:ribosome modulation factor
MTEEKRDLAFNVGYGAYLVYLVRSCRFITDEERVAYDDGWRDAAFATCGFTTDEERTAYDEGWGCAVEKVKPWVS